MATPQRFVGQLDPTPFRSPAPPQGAPSPFAPSPAAARASAAANSVSSISLSFVPTSPAPVHPSVAAPDPEIEMFHQSKPSAVPNSGTGEGVSVELAIPVDTVDPSVTAVAATGVTLASSRMDAALSRSQFTRDDPFSRKGHTRNLMEAIESMDQWATANEKENEEFQETVRLAKNLFVAVVASQHEDDELMMHTTGEEADTRCHATLLDVEKSGLPGNSTSASLTPRSAALQKVMGTSSEFLGDETARKEAAHGVTRAAVACLLLERICCVFGRYHAVLGPLCDMITRSVFVPDTEEMRRLLGGSVHFSLRGVPTKYRSLMAPYARKTYSIAHDEVAEQVMALAKNNRAVEMRLSRQGKIFDITVKHWVASIVRNLFLSWRHFTRSRKALRRKFQAKFSRLRVEELKSRVIQNWRDRAMAVRRASALDAGAAEIAQLTQSTEQLHQMIVSLTDMNNQVSQRIVNQERERQQMLASIAAKEKLFVELQSRTVEMDRVGTELLESMLLSEPPPRGNSAIEVLVAWGHQMIDDAGGTIDNSFEPLRPLLSEDFVVMVPLSALAAVMIRFNHPEAPTREEVTMLHNTATRAPQMLIDMYERLTSGPCLVNEEQVSTMQRGVLLLFLAGLMRHMSNWVVNKPYLVPPVRKRAVQRTLLGGEDAIRRRRSTRHRSTASLSLAALGRDPSAAGAADGADLLDEDEFVNPADLAPQHATWMDRVKMQQQWITTSMAALHLALEASTQRPVALTSEEQEDMVTFLDLSMGSVYDILPRVQPDTVFVQLLKNVQQIFPELRKVYLSYAVPVMHFMDFIRLAKDCRLFGPNKLKKKEVEQMCREVYVKHASTAGRKGGAKARGGGGGGSNQSPRNAVAEEHYSDDEEAAEEDERSKTKLSASAASPSVSPRHTTQAGGGAVVAGVPPIIAAAATNIDISIKLMEPKVFTEVMIRTALLYHRKMVKDKYMDLTPGMVSSFIMEAIVPHALRLDVDRFRQTARHPLVRQVLSRHKVALRRAFRRYATVNDGEAIPKHQFLQMAKDCRWMSKTITTDVLQEVYRRCQSGAQDGDPSGASDGLDLSEWHEVLCALAVFADPNPLVPLYIKLPIFIEEKVLSALQL